MRHSKKSITELSYKIVGCAIEVHKALGPGLLESIYEKCLIHELQIKGYKVESQLRVPLVYKGLETTADLRLDILVEDSVIVEVKAVETMHPIYTLTNLKKS